MWVSKRRSEGQEDLCISTVEIVTSRGHPFYSRLHRLSDEHCFDGFAGDRYREFFAGTGGHPSVPPGLYSPMLPVAMIFDLAAPASGFLNAPLKKFAACGRYYFPVLTRSLLWARRH